MTRNDMLYLGDSRDGVEVTSSEGGLLFLLGGEPFEDEIVMWWNFAGRSHDEIAAAREDWEAASPGSASSRGTTSASLRRRFPRCA